jgi:hypothetical protein
MAAMTRLGFPISAKNKNLVYDHPMNISAKFGSNLFCGFRRKKFKTFFPIGSYVNTTVCPLKTAILDGGQGHWTQF